MDAIVESKEISQFDAQPSSALDGTFKLQYIHL